MHEAALAREDRLSFWLRRLEGHGDPRLVASIGELEGVIPSRAQDVAGAALEHDQEAAQQRRRAHQQRMRRLVSCDLDRDPAQVGMVPVQLEYLRHDVLQAHRFGADERLRRHAAKELQQVVEARDLVGERRDHLRIERFAVLEDADDRFETGDAVGQLVIQPLEHLLADAQPLVAPDAGRGGPLRLEVGCCLTNLVDWHAVKRLRACGHQVRAVSRGYDVRSPA